MRLQDRVGLNIQELRRAKKMSQEELADRSKVHQTYLSGVETGKRNPSLLVLERIAAALGVDPEELVRRRRRRSSESADS
ncbi:helix-turn-helix domain-containing protein [Bradyrhizobium neotropicale]|uniref:helix-turn-helix domain-containing protein n=1 Tax=Bradyrhizobium neotropicale TaxID=1497615 RepID=UPI001AD76F34|nr:helix-turn-helix transcriptional regulator [Bradyrhizobium neotropicale]MBO4225339.1 helix-turn-helix domain-containing protein [Bradyrhizobium neotropicale]